MASGDNQATFESWLNQATDPNNQEERWDCIQAFYQLVDQEHDGPQVAIRLLAHKIQSPQEKEALQALTVLEACMNNCGKKFHSEAAKFRFLNELIKLLTPKYFGAWTPQTVKDRVTEVLYGWTLWLKEEPKIQEAYSMLKKQGIVKKDPKLPDKVIMPPPTQRTTDSVFDQEDKATLLARLLKSARPEDLETANRLIKSTIKEEQEKAEKASKRESTLKEVESSTKELRELLERQVVTESQDGKVLYERCERLRPSLFRLASDTMDDDAALAQILAANDELTLVVNAYKDRAGKKECNGGRERRRSEEETEAPKSPREIKSYHLIDLSALDSPPTHRKSESPPPSSPSSSSSPSSLPSSSSPTSSSLLESDPHALAEQHLNESDHRVSKWTSRSYYDELLQQLNGEIHVENGGSDVSLRARGCSPSNGSDFCQPFPPVSPSKLVSETCGDSGKADELLKKIFVPVETIRPSNLEPITVYDQGGVHVSLHFAKDCPAGQPGVAVAVVSTVNTSALAVKDYLLQAAVPKTVMLKLQPASGTELPPYNPLLPPPAISQVLLLANPHRRKLRLRYKLALTHGDRRLNEGGEIDNFPDWTSLITRWNQLNSGTQQ